MYIPAHTLTKSSVSCAADGLDNPQQNDGAHQRYEHGREGDGIVDRTTTKQRTEEVTG